MQVINQSIPDGLKLRFTRVIKYVRWYSRPINGNPTNILVDTLRNPSAHLRRHFAKFPPNYNSEPRP